MRTLLGSAVAALALTACSGAGSVAVAPAGPYAGQITLTSLPDGWSMQANFTTAEAADAGVCPGATIGACCVFSQPQWVIADGDSVPPVVGAGTLTVADGDKSLATASFAGYGYHPISSSESSAPGWSPGDVLSLSAAGSAVDSFSGSVVAPPAFTAVSPQLSPTEISVVRLSTDLQLSWSPADGYAGSVTAQLFDVNGFYVTCSGPDAAGSLTLPLETFANFAAADTGTLTLSRADSVSIQTLNATVNLSAVSAASGNVTFLP